MHQKHILLGKQHLGLEERNLCCFPALFQSEAGSYLGSQADLGVPSHPGTQGAHLLPPPDTDSSF